MGSIVGCVVGEVNEEVIRYDDVVEEVDEVVRG